MNKTKKMLSGLLAVLMLISMLTCFTLPASAITPNGDIYYVATSAQWREVIKLINASSDYFAGKTIYLQNDINYKGNYLDIAANFAGTFDGNGYKIVNVGDPEAPLTKKTGASLIGTLTGTIQNLTIDSTYNVVDNYSSRTESGAFAAISNGGTIKNCAFFGTYTTTAGVKAGGFVGNVETNGLTIEGCVFGGTVASSTTGGTAGAFFGYKRSAAMTKIVNSVATGTLTGKNTGMACAGGYLATKNKFTNSYAIGMKILPYGGTLTADMSTNADVEEAATETDLKRAVWTINDQRNDGLYFSVDAAGIPCFGSFNDRVVRVEYMSPVNTEEYYAPCSQFVEGSVTYYGQSEFYPQTANSSLTLVVSGAEYRDGKIYVNHEDITVNYVNATDYTLQQKKDKLQAMVDAYNAMQAAYVTKGDAINTWISNADTALKKQDVTEDDIDTLIDQEDAIDDGIKTTMSNPEDYPSIADYNTYKYVEEITDYKVADKDDWMAAVDMSDYVKHPDTAVNFSGVTLHLTADIKMGSAEMMPLCYGWVFDGNLNGHDFAFENINIKADNAYGPVGLIGAFGSASGRKIENLGIASGSITVTGWPRYKSDLQCEEQGNKVGGFVGKAIGSSAVFRKCWNNADINVENVDAAAGIIADARNAAIIDSCFNMGTSKISSMFGIAGHAENSAKIYNSVSGATGEGLVQDRAGTYEGNPATEGNAETNINKIIDAIEKGNINVCGVVATLTLNNLVSNAARQRVQIKAQDQYNDANSAMSVAEAAWKVNINYQHQKNLGSTNKRNIYYTLNENGEVRFGKSTSGNDQILRIKLVCAQDGENCTTHPVRYTYGAGYNATEGPMKTTSLDVDAKANYYACPDEHVIIEGNTVSFTAANNVTKIGTTDTDTPEDQNTFVVYVGYDADRGNVKQDYDGDGKSKINVLDVLAAVKMVVETDETKKNKLTADLNGNYEVDINDAYEIIRHVFNHSKKPTFTFGKPANREYLKVLTYNVKGLQYVPDRATKKTDDNPTIYTATAMCRYGAVLNELKEIDADIIGFQEITRFTAKSEYNGTQVDQLVQMGTDLGMSYNLFTVTDPTSDGATTDGKNNGGGSGILSKYPFVLKENGEPDYGEVFFAGKILEGDETKTLDDSNARAFTWVKIDVNNDKAYNVNDDIIFVNCHFAEHHEEQIRYMVNYMEETFPNSEGHRIVYVGDFNFAPYKMRNVFAKEEPYTFLNGGKYNTTFIRTNAHSGSLIDNVLVNGNVEYFQPLPNETGLYTRMGVYDRNQTLVEEDDESQKIVKEKQDEINYWAASDHLPVWAFIKK